MEYQKMDKVLVVDDEKSIRLTLSEFLDVEGYKVDLAADFWKAKEFLKNNSYDAFIFDIVL
ncbi:MAG: response regulator, partial [Methanosarcinales archaeon]